MTDNYDTKTNAVFKGILLPVIPPYTSVHFIKSLCTVSYCSCEPKLFGFKLVFCGFITSQLFNWL